MDRALVENGVIPARDGAIFSSALDEDNYVLALTMFLCAPQRGELPDFEDCIVSTAGNA